MADVKIANPGPLGLAGFALTTFVLSLVNANVLQLSNITVVIGLAVFYGGIAQFSAGMWEFRSGNTFGATAFTSYGAFWLSFAALLIPGFGINFGSDKGPSSAAVGWYLIAWAVITGILMLASFRTNGATAAVFILLFITYIVLGIGFLQGTSGANIIQAGGWLGVATAIAAWYTAAAGVLASVNGGKNVLPVFPLTRA